MSDDTTRHPLTNAERQRRWRDKQRGGPPTKRDPIPCPSPAAAQRHRRNGEPVCDACKRACADAQAARRAAKRATDNTR